MSNDRGRPMIYEDPKEMRSDIEEYFEMCDVKDKPKTILGLCNYLDITRQTLNNYQDRDKFFDTVKKAKDVCEQHVNEKALNGEYNPTMAIFNLKNNFGWEDRKKQEIEGDGVINVNIEDD